MKKGGHDTSHHDRWPTGTELNGQKVMRTCIVNHKASWEGIEETLELIRELGEKLHTGSE